MTKSTITRERLEEIVSDPMINQGSEFAMMARMALAAMDSSESVELPLDYLQGHKDGLEWAAQLAEANHPETGDWLYDDPIELAKAIRKGPDMSPSQPALDTEPVAYTDERNLGYIDRGRETAYLWGKQNSETGDVPLYRHAQPAVDSDFIPKNLDKALGVVGVAIPESREEFNLQAERWIQRLIDRVIRYADEFQGQPAPVVPEEATSDSIEILASARRRDHAVFQWGEDQRNAAADSWNSCRAAMLQAGNSPAQSDCCPAQSDCCPAQNSDAPAQGGNSLVIPDEMTSGQAYEIGYYY